ncbi:MAG: M1 family peptidase [Sphingobacteriales bacterium]|nr:MAG: M1 family peptidase [Sphingobacteriales bacterium]
MKFSFKTIIVCVGYLLLANTLLAYTQQDTLRGSNGRGRSWWDVVSYDLDVHIDTTTKSIKGHNRIQLKAVSVIGDSLQIDMQEPLIIDSITFHNRNQFDQTGQPISGKLKFEREGNVYWLTGNYKSWKGGLTVDVDVYYHGIPRSAKLPPWEGGFIWTEDSTGKPWIAVACQGLGASSWWPCKDYQGDEPEWMAVNVRINEGLQRANIDSPGSISNGRLALFIPPGKNAWHVRNPINTYSATFYIGDYVSWTDTVMGEKGRLDMSFYCLRYNEEKARKQFVQAKDMIHCFEYWMGPYPFYEDGYKLVEAPYLGMEHQSAVAYGNGYKQGYKGDDRSGTGVGTLFDFIIIHESGHEWFGNNITAQDIADNWLHEGFTTYTEGLYAEWIAGKEKAFEYIRGEWKNIRNDKPVIGDYGVNDDGSSDKYDKGAAVVHMIRMMMNDDTKFRQLLRGLNKDFYHKIVTSAEVEQYIIQFTGLPLQKFFDQYLRNRDVPVLEWYIKKDKLYYRFTNTIEGFTLPLTITDGEKSANIKATGKLQSINWQNGGYNVSISKDFLVQLKP